MEKTINKKLTFHIRREFRNSLSREDFEECENDAYFKTLKYWKEDRGASFQSFFCLLFRQACLDLINRRKNEIKAYSAKDFKDKSYPELRNLVFLSDFHRALLIDRFFGNMTYDEIGEKYGYSRQWAYEHVDKAIQIAKVFVK